MNPQYAKRKKHEIIQMSELGNEIWDQLNGAESVADDERRGGLFRRHVLGRVSWEVHKNLIRLAGDGAAAVDAAIADLRAQATAWVDAELTTLERILDQRPNEATVIRDALRQLQETSAP